METNVVGRIESGITISEIRIRYCLYARKSTESDEMQALSIDSQVKEMLAIAERLSLNIVTIKREAHSAKDSGQRPVFKELIEEIRKEDVGIEEGDGRSLSSTQFIYKRIVSNPIDPR